MTWHGAAVHRVCMAAPSLNQAPSSIVAGETISFLATAAGYSSADGYAVAYSFGGATATVVAEGTGWRVTVANSVTLAWSPGRVRFAGMATKASATTCIDSGEITVDANPAVAAASAATLALIDAAIAAYAVNPTRNMSIDGVQVTFKDFAELTAMRDHYAAKVARESGASRSRVILTRFV